MLSQIQVQSLFMEAMYNMIAADVLIKELEQIDEQVGSADPCKLVVWNDEINTFDWVIQSLMDICDHSPEQAEQCAWIIHTKGKYSVKEGSMNKLRPMRESLTDRGIGATIE
ncbi:MAG: ATP-dependent Clp protease adaptor ClpS [Bacteroidota bacterium]